MNSSFGKFINKTPKKIEEPIQENKDNFFNRLTQSISPILEKYNNEKQHTVQKAITKKHISKSFEIFGLKKVMPLFTIKRRSSRQEQLTRFKQLIERRKQSKKKVQIVIENDKNEITNKDQNAKHVSEEKPKNEIQLFEAKDNKQSLPNVEPMDEFQEQAQRNRFSKSIRKTIPKLNLDAYNTETELANLNLNHEENNADKTPRVIKKRSYSEEKVDLSRN